jgi:uncharacterized membrane protein YgcG
MRSPSVVFRICAATLLGLGLASIATAQNREKFVISAKAGGVNVVDGHVTVSRKGKSEELTAQDNLTAGDLVTTGAASQVEVLLNPGSYLRVGENSVFEVTDNSLENVRVRLIKGSAIVEATGLNEIELHITIVAEPARVIIARRGIYRINVSVDSTELLVRSGLARINDDPRNVIKGGNGIVFRSGSFVATKLGKTQPDRLDDWSKERANTLAKANQKLPARGLNTYLASFDNADWDWWRTGGFWAFSPFSRCFTFLPLYYGWSSPYGYNYGSYYRLHGDGLYCGLCSGVADHRGIHIREPISGGSSRGSSGGGSTTGGSSGGSSGGGSAGGSSGGSGNGQPPNPPPSPVGQREPDSGARSPSRPKDPID